MSELYWKYMGESDSNINKHNGDLKKGNMNNGLGRHNLETNENSDFKIPKF